MRVLAPNTGSATCTSAWHGAAPHKEDYLFMGAFHPESRGMLDRTSAALMFGAGLRL